MSAPEVIPTGKFNTGTTIRGITRNTLMASIALTVPIYFLLQLFISGVPLLAVVALIWWFGILKLTELLIEVIPPGLPFHILEWLIAGGQLIITNDSSPIPIEVERQSDLKEAAMMRERNKRIYSR